MEKQGGKRKVSFASSPTLSGHGSGETGGASPPEDLRHGGRSSGSAPSTGTDTLPSKKGVTFAPRKRQSESGDHGGPVPMEESSRNSYKKEQQQQQQPQKQKQKQKQPQRQVVIVPRYVYKLDGSPAEYETKFEKLHPKSQKLVLKIQERIREHRVESQILDEHSRLYDSLGSGRYFEDDARYFNQQIRGLRFAHGKEQILAKELRDVSVTILRATDVAVCSYAELRKTFHLGSSARTLSVHTSTQTDGSTGTYSAADQPSTWPFPTASGFPFRIARPSLFMLKTVARFDEYLTKISQQIVELEQLVQSTGESSSSDESSLQSIPRIMSNVHDFFIHVAAKAETLHQHLEAMKKACHARFH
ncbi:putative nucleoporin p58/p45 [Dioscorea sansibarensis]